MKSTEALFIFAFIFVGIPLIGLATVFVDVLRAAL
jgi:hypothetical protein